MKRIILLGSILLLTCACSVNYDLVIDENENIEESISIQAENESESQQLYSDPWPIKAYYSDPDSGDYPEKLEGVEYYDNEVVLDKNYYKKNLTHISNIQKFEDINSIKSCYEHFYVTSDSKNNTYTLSTSPEFLCFLDYPSLNEVNIKIHVANTVTSSNASSRDGNTYEWKITKDNYQTSGIILTFQKQEMKESEEKKTESPNIMWAFGVLGIFFVIIIGIFLYKIKKNL